MVPGRIVVPRPKELNELAPDGFDLAILGIGKDGHFASIFPGFTQWETENKTVVTETTENEVMERLSISPKYLLKAKRILVLLAGEDKSPILEKLADENLSKENFPAKFLLQHPNLEIIFSEEAAY
jgi:6-phosphogluconolactonase